MTKKEIEKFVSRLAGLVPSLFTRTNLVETEIYNDVAVLEFQLPEPIDIDELMDLLEDHIDMIPLYHVIPSGATRFGQRVAAYSDPSHGDMFKVNAMSDDNGQVDTIFITIYESLMTMGMETRGELEDMSQKYKVKYGRSVVDVLRDFMR